MARLTRGLRSHHNHMLYARCRLHVVDLHLYVSASIFSEKWNKCMWSVKCWECTNLPHSSVYRRVSFCDGSFYDDSLLRPLSSRTEHTRLVMHHCRKSSVLSLLSTLLALFRCACFSSFSILVQFFWVDCGFFYPPTPIKKTEKKKKSKQMTLHSFMMSSEPPPGPTSTK